MPFQNIGLLRASLGRAGKGEGNCLDYFLAFVVERNLGLILAGGEFLGFQAGQNLRAAATDAWWLASPPEESVVFTLHIEQAVFVDWDIKPGLMTVHRWSSANGYTVASRSHP